MEKEKNTKWVDIGEITQKYLPISKRKARRFVSMYLMPKKVGNRIYVDRKQLEMLLDNPNREQFPLNF